MPRHATPLSARRVQTVKERGFYCDLGWLHRQVSRTGSKSWVFRYALYGRKRDMGLGSLTTFNTGRGARAGAAKDGGNWLPMDLPASISATKRVAPLPRLCPFRQCAERYVAAHEASWRNGGKVRLASREPCLLDLWRYAGGGDHLPLVIGDRTALDGKAGHREPGAQPRRDGARLGEGAWAAPGRKPGAVERSSRYAATASQEGGSRSAPRDVALPRGRPVHGRFEEAHRHVARALEYQILTAARSGEALPRGGTRSI